MSRRFVIAVAGPSTDEEKNIKTYFGEIGGWWHWIANFWLLNIDDELLTAEQIGKKIKAMTPGRRILVMEIPESIDWWGSGKKNAKGQSMFTWLQDVWPN